MIDESLSMPEIEGILKKNISAGKKSDSIKIWGELNLSEEEYSILMAKLHEYFGNRGFSLKELLERYSVSIATAAVFMTKYRYDRNFWGAFSAELGRELNPVQQKQVGSACLEVFENAGFDYDEADMVHPYLDPLCYEAGVPTAGSLDGLFYALKYDDSHNFDAQQIIDDLIDERTYGVRKTLIRYLKQFKDGRAIDCVLEIHDAILSVDQGIPGDSWYSSSYADWLKKELERTTKEKEAQQNVSAKPYLIFDEHYGLCMQMPKLFLDQEYIEKPKWTIICEGNDRLFDKSMNVFDDGNRKRIGETMIPLPPAGKYTVSLIDADDNGELLYDPWEIPGVPEGSILFFNANGRAITPRFLPYPYVTLLLADNGAKIVSLDFVDDAEQYYPLFQGTRAKVVTITPQDYRAELRLYSAGKMLSLEARPRIDVELHGEHLFHMAAKNEQPVFTELPVLTLDVDEAEHASGFEIRCGQTRLDMANMNGDNHYELPLSRFEDKCFAHYGVYSIRIYKNGLFLKSIDFGYAPFVDTTYNPLLSWPTRKDFNKAKKLEFDFSKAAEENPDLDLSLDFGRSIVRCSETHCTVECLPYTGILKGSLIISKKGQEDAGKLNFPFALPLRPFDITVIKANGNAIERQANTMGYQLTLEDMEKEEYWALVDCYGEYKRKEYVLKLHNINGYVQTQKLKKCSGNSLRCNLSVFSSTLRNCLLPARIELFASDEGENSLPIVTFSSEAELGALPMHRYIDGKSQVYFRQSADKGKDLILKSFREPDLKIIVPHAESFTQTNKKGITYRMFEMPELQPGFYSISAGEKEEEDPFAFEEEFGVALSNGYDTLYVTRVPKRTVFPSFSEWLDSLMKDIMVAGTKKDFADKATYQEVENGGLNRFAGTVLCEADLENLTALSWLGADRNKCDPDKLFHIRRCISEITCVVLNADSRTALAKYILSISCPPRIIKACIFNYDFNLMNTSCEDAAGLAEQIAPYSDELALMVLMGQNMPMAQVLNERGARVFCNKAIWAMITVPDEADPDIVKHERQKFRREMPNANITIELPADLVGKQEWVDRLASDDAPFSGGKKGKKTNPAQKSNVTNKQSSDLASKDKWIESMMKNTSNTIHVNLDNIPDEGISFNGARFPELYIKWLRLRRNKDSSTRDVQLMNQVFEPVMIRAVEEDCKTLMKYYKAARNDPASSLVQHRYNHGIRERYKEDPTANLSIGIPLRFVYMQAVAAFLALMPARYNPNPEAVHTAQHFLAMASRVDTDLARRDILMAATFYYLIGKEETLCQ